METLWTKIIWGKLGMKDYPIHKHTSKEMVPLIIQWMKQSSKEEILETIKSIGANLKKNVDYYDGNFHELDTGGDNHYWLHDSNILPFILEFFIEFPELLEDIDLIKYTTKEYLKIAKTKKERHWKEYCPACKKNHIVSNKPCPTCGVYETPQPSDKVYEKCHANYQCDGCEAYNDHLK